MAGESGDMGRGGATVLSETRTSQEWEVGPGTNLGFTLPLTGGASGKVSTC